MPTAILDFSSSEFIADPYPQLSQLRSEGAVIWDAGFRSNFSHGFGAWHIVRYAAVQSALQSPNLSSELHPPKLELFSEADGKMLTELLEQNSKRNLLFADPPDHTRLRQLVSKAFTPQRVEALRPKVQQLVDGLLDAVQNSGRMDVVQDLAMNLSIAVIAEMLGFPREDSTRIVKWIENDFAFFAGQMPIELSYQSRLEYLNYLYERVAERRKQPKDDLLNALIVARDRGDKLSEQEIVGTMHMLFNAGYETTMSQIGNGMLALLHHPNQLEMLRNDLSLIKSAIEEMVRYDCVGQFMHRKAKDDHERDGQQIKQGQDIFIWFASANRDANQFSHPNQFDITRQENRHMGFGAGIHHCLGAPLARLEMEVAFTTMLLRLPNITLAGKPDRRSNAWVRGLYSLPIAFGI